MGNKYTSKTKHTRRRAGKVDTLLNDKLNNVEWGEYIYLNKLFDIKRGKRLTIENRISGDRPLVTAGFENTGIAGYISNIEQEIFPANTITIDMFGNTFYRNYSYSADDNILVLFEKSTMSENSKLFITSLISRKLANRFDYGKQFRIGSYNNTSIQLPTKNGAIDFDFMESFTAELEQERMQTLQAYLQATDLENYELTKEEEKALEDYEKLEFAEFPITKVFDIKNTGNILSRDIVPNSGKTPYLGAGSENNSVSSYIRYDEKYLDKGNCVFIGGKTFVVTYQEKDFFSNDSHNLTLTLKNEMFKNKLTQLFLVTCVNKSLGYKYSWGDSVSNKKIQKDLLSLPTTNKEENYKAMEPFIRAIQKLVIKDVVLYVNNKKWLN